MSVGVLITDGRQFLACHSTGNSFYDLPKGLKEEGETPVEAGIRETREETGIELDAALLEDLGVFPYLRNKDLHLFRWTADQLPDVKQLRCTSYFIHPRSGKKIPEADGYKYVLFEQLEKDMAKSMAKLLRSLYPKEMDVL
ncbi:NUDIX hydrolase [Paenibacillus gansuensis]|uniref:NUDIX domain-containing protein n=1 Tax=Paenibacillus gansuensis TaxID=306542 RepID=A0ABW5P8U9_9BACL